MPEGFPQRLRQGVTPPKTIGLHRRIGVLFIHLAWTGVANYLILFLIQFALIRGSKYFENPEAESLRIAGRIVWPIALFVLDPAACALAAILTVCCAVRQLGIEPKDALGPLAPPLLIILAVTGIPAALICAVLVLAYFIGFLLALLLAPYFLTIVFALLYLLWLKWRGEVQCDPVPRRRS